MIELPAWCGDNIAILGLGRTGLSAAAALTASGANVWAWDDGDAARAAAAAAGVRLADLRTKSLAGFSALVLSPGIPHTHPAPHEVVTRFRALGISIFCDIELLLNAGDGTLPRVVGITGTNGKSTTTALIGHILAACHVPCRVGGNLGHPVLAFEPLPADGVYVLELSSYQLELTPSLAPDVGVLLNITPDHLARHGGMEGYVAAKRSLFRGREVTDGIKQAAVIGVDDAPSRETAQAIIGSGFQVATLSVEGRPATISVENGVLQDHRNGFAADLSGIPALPGKHNQQNAAAAYAAATALGLPRDAVMAAMRSFPGLPHRQKIVAEIEGIRFINDSKATNADAAAKALGCYKAVYWIAGGQAKEGGLSGLEAFMPRVRHAFLIGEAQEDFAGWLEGRAPVTRSFTLDRAIRDAFAAARRDRAEGAVVLLSPACASWDQFRSFEHRGDVFTELARQLEGAGVTA